MPEKILTTNNKRKIHMHLPFSWSWNFQTENNYPKKENFDEDIETCLLHFVFYIVHSIKMNSFT